MAISTPDRPAFGVLELTTARAELSGFVDRVVLVADDMLATLTLSVAEGDLAMRVVSTTLAALTTIGSM